MKSFHKQAGKGGGHRLMKLYHKIALFTGDVKGCLELFRKFIRFGMRIRPLITKMCCNILNIWPKSISIQRSGYVHSRPSLCLCCSKWIFTKVVSHYIHEWLAFWGVEYVGSSSSSLPSKYSSQGRQIEGNPPIDSWINRKPKEWVSTPPPSPQPWHPTATK